MKHRSVIAFVLLAATLAAVPQVSQDLLELKSALGERVRNEMWHAFLSVNGRGGASQAAPQRTQHTLASCNAAPANAGAKKSSAPARATAQAGSAASAEAVREVEAEELAMMLTPPAESVEEKGTVEAAEDLRELRFGRVLKAPTRAPLPVQEMAMIIPPGEGADPVLPGRLVAAEAEAKTARARARRDEAARVSYVATAFTERGVEFRKVGDVMRFQFNNVTKDGFAVPPAPAAPKARVTKVKRQQATTVTAPVVIPAGQAKQLACLALEMSRADADSE
jgi:hypothetical protein